MCAASSRQERGRQLAAVCRKLAAIDSLQMAAACREYAAVRVVMVRPLELQVRGRSSRELEAAPSFSSRPYLPRAGGQRDPIAASSRPNWSPCWPPRASFILSDWPCGQVSLVARSIFRTKPKFHSADATCQHRAPLKITPNKYSATIQ